VRSIALCALALLILIANSYADDTNTTVDIKTQGTTTSPNTINQDKKPTLSPELLVKVQDLIKKDDILVSRESSDDALFQEFEGCMLGKRKKPCQDIPDMAKRLKDDIGRIEKGVKELRAQWENINVPGKSGFGLLKNVEMVRLEAFLLALEAKRQYVETLDPTYKAYYKEYLNQGDIFSKRVKSLLGSMKDVNGPGPRSQ